VLTHAHGPALASEPCGPGLAQLIDAVDPQHPATKFFLIILITISFFGLMLNFEMLRKESHRYFLTYPVRLCFGSAFV
jgi:hypothetical protein